MAFPQSQDEQPISRVTWRDPDELVANDFNPNRVFGPEMRLLKISIMESGWTQPIVVTQDDVIVDGFHRWSLGKVDEDVRRVSGNMVPVVVMQDTSPELHQMSTIRHNRARGQHYVVRMADVVATLIGLGIEEDEISRRLQMDMEEVSRLADRGSMIKRRTHDGEGDDAMSRAWTPTEKDEEKV